MSERVLGSMRHASGLVSNHTLSSVFAPRLMYLVVAPDCPPNYPIQPHFVSLANRSRYIPDSIKSSSSLHIRSSSSSFPVLQTSLQEGG